MARYADLILANRAYMDHETPRSAESRTQPGNGGLLAAVRPVIAPWDGGTGTTWIGAGRGRYDADWCDQEGVELIPTPQGELRHRRLFFDDATWLDHYGMASNSFLWPLLHLVREPLPERTGYYPAPAIPTPPQWHHYVDVNRRFAAAALEETHAGRSCWVHDYQLALVPAMLRSGRFGGKVGFFLHTPFPSMRIADSYLNEAALDLFRQWVRGILGSNLVGLQSTGDVERFTAAAVKLCGANQSAEGLEVDGRRVRVEACPVGIDVAELTAVARSAPRPRRLESVPAGLPVVVGLERDDYTKGIPERLEAVARAYRGGARFAYVGIAAPTRAGVPAYKRLSEAVNDASASAARAADERNVPFSHTREVVEWAEVVALQREADVVFTSSLADGLNLVPLQAALAQAESPGERAVLITGRDAGVASAYAGYERDGLVPVDPLNADAMTTVLRNALEGRPGRVSDRLINAVRTNDARAWATRFLTELDATC